jgi:hypothetical protein
MWSVIRIQKPLPNIHVVFETSHYVSALERAIQCQKIFLETSKHYPVEIDSLRTLHKLVEAQERKNPYIYYVASHELK